LREEVVSIVAGILKLTSDHMTFSRSLRVALALSILSVPATSWAQAAGFALDRFDPSERGSDWFVLESLDFRGHLRPAAGLVADWAYKPLVIYRSSGEERAALVGNQLLLHVGGAMVMWDRARVALDMPLALYQSGDGGVVAGTTFVPPDQASPGDLRVGVDALAFGRYGSPFSLAGGVQFYFPTGDRAAFTGDGKIRIVPRVIAAGKISQFEYAVKLGIAYRPQNEAFAGTAMGSEALVAASAGVRVLEDRVLVGPELWGTTGISQSDAFFSRRTSPFEVLFGAHTTFAEDFRVGAGVGPGLTRGFGAPQVRFVLSAEWAPAYHEPAPPPLPPAPPPPPPDRDKDGILDAEDACPDVPGVKTDDPKTNGCPPDRDKDGIIDTEDACPDVPGVKTDDPKTNGCPPDRDKDGIIDAEDACPDVPGVKTDDPKTNGCPPARIEAGEIKITQQVKFKFDSAIILPESDLILSAVATIMREHPEIERVRVEGHTDDKGTDAYNMTLSARRAASVVKWLLKHGTEKSRLSSKGYGRSRPLDTNGTDEGRQNNRRVELHIEEKKPQDKKPQLMPASGKP
jgi:outer membrane protein OmpA-like peptidoglycan-associated protein